VVTTPGAAVTQPAAGASPIATRPAGTTPAAGTTPQAGATATAPGVREYTVSSGDTVSSICEKNKPASMTLPDCVERVIALNSLSSAGTINIGDKLRIPQ
jgi:Tfp pilus assembly protein FimV